MASSWANPPVGRYLGVYRRRSRWDSPLAALLPESYKKFWYEWRVLKPAAVHYIHEEGRYKRNEVTGEVFPIQNVPIPLRRPAEFHQGLWGNEAIIKGFKKKSNMRRRVGQYWVPNLKRSVVYSEILNVYLSVVITDRLMRLVHDNFGFDHYILKTPACDLQSVLALTIKKHMLKALTDKCPAYNDDLEKQKEIYEKYQQYLGSYSSEDIEWYGLPWNDAIQKAKTIAKIKNESGIKPLKHEYRSELIEQLKTAGIIDIQKEPSDQISWISKINPFSKKRET